MLLQDILNLPYDNAHEIMRISKDDTICEATARVLRFNYERAKNDPKPRVLVLGRWLHPRTSNKLVAGINLNYLNNDELLQLGGNLSQIMGANNLKTRWWTGYGLLPKIWLKAYRQYDERFIHSASKADLKPAAKDYEEPEQPGEKKKLPPATQAVIDKLKEVEAQKKSEPPKEPSKGSKTIRLSKDSIKRIINLIKNKLAKRKQEEPEPEPEQEKEVQELERLEQQEQEEEKPEESFAHKVNTIIEAIIKPKELFWRSNNNYIYWHRPDRFIEYTPRLHGSVMDHTTGKKLMALYNIATESLIIDLADDIHEMLAYSGWDWNNTIRIIADKKFLLEHDMSDNGQIFIDKLKKNPFWGIFKAFYNV